jgi:hypothetical protein
MSEQTKAEIRARALAKALGDIGWKVRVEVKPIEAVLYSSGDVMLPARVMAHVRADGPHAWDMYGFSFITWMSAPGRRSSTKFCGAHLYRLAGGSKKLSLKELRSRIGSEVASARYAASRAV